MVGALRRRGSFVVKITYAHRRSAFYPFDDHGGPGNELPPSDIRAPWLAAVRARGFEGLEVGERVVMEWTDRLRDGAEVEVVGSRRMAEEAAENPVLGGGEAAEREAQ